MLPVSGSNSLKAKLKYLGLNGKTNLPIEISIGAFNTSNINLTSQGAQDWAIYVSALSTPSDRKLNGNVLGNIINNANTPIFTTSSYVVNWTDGTTTLVGNNGGDGGSAGDDGAGTVDIGVGNSFTVPAGTGHRQLKVFCTTNGGASFRVQATLNDNSYPTQIADTLVRAASTPAIFTVSIGYHASQANSGLTVSITKLTENSAGEGYVALQAIWIGYSQDSKAMGYGLPLSTGNYSYAGLTNTLKVKRSLSLAVGSYSYTGLTASFKVNRNLPLATGSYTYSGINSNLTRSVKVNLAVGTYNYSGIASSIKLERKLALSAGNYAYNGLTASLSYVAGSVSNVNYTLLLNSGNYSYSGLTANLTYLSGNTQVNYSLTLATGNYIIIGNTASFIKTGAYGSQFLIGGDTKKPSKKISQKEKDRLRKLEENFAPIIDAVQMRIDVEKAMGIQEDEDDTELLLMGY